MGKLDNLQKVLMTFGFILISLVIFNYVIFSVVIPAKISVIAVCYPEEAQERDIIIIAQTQTTFDQVTGVPTSTVTYFAPPSIQTIKHEQAHVAQSKRIIKFSGSCRFPLQKFMREAEAYLAEDIPNPIYKIIYNYDPTNPVVLEV